MNTIKKWFVNVLIGLDQFGNTIIGGDPDETISSRLGRLKLANGGRIPWTHPMSKVIDWGLDKIDTNHSIDAIEPEDHHKDEVVPL